MRVKTNTQSIISRKTCTPSALSRATRQTHAVVRTTQFLRKPIATKRTFFFAARARMLTDNGTTLLVSIVSTEFLHETCKKTPQTPQINFVPAPARLESVTQKITQSHATGLTSQTIVITIHFDIVRTHLRIPIKTQPALSFFCETRIPLRTQPRKRKRKFLLRHGAISHRLLTSRPNNNVFSIRPL